MADRSAVSAAGGPGGVGDDVVGFTSLIALVLFLVTVVAMLIIPPTL